MGRWIKRFDSGLFDLSGEIIKERKGWLSLDEAGATGAEGSTGDDG